MINLWFNQPGQYINGLCSTCAFVIERDMWLIDRPCVWCIFSTAFQQDDIPLQADRRISRNTNNMAASVLHTMKCCQETLSSRIDFDKLETLESDARPTNYKLLSLSSRRELWCEWLHQRPHFEGRVEQTGDSTEPDKEYWPASTAHEG